MKNLLAIFLATALLVGCGGEIPESGDKNNFSQEEWESFVEWCNQNKAADAANCGGTANILERYINEKGFEEDCLVIVTKRIVATGDIEAGDSADCAPN